MLLDPIILKFSGILGYKEFVSRVLISMFLGCFHLI